MTNRFERPEAVIFDMDGTLFETATLLETVHERLFRTLREEGLYDQIPPFQELLGCLGMLLEDIWRKLMPGSTEEARHRADELMVQYELEELEAGRGSLYPQTKETLQRLKEQGIKLFVASNGLEVYVKEVARFKEIAELFDGLYSAGEFQTASKVDLVAKLLADHRIKTAWMVGDRSSDVEAAKGNGLVAIGCAYAGYGRDSELADADVCIQNMPELLDLLR
ncbi:HAD hydrolase-like protein [Paenibacillus glycanilyticus]|uniref:MTA/SAH nucleosidase n=1 Tax=Paenibacillus glycanilyticus TaxID=126569 RepID=A0ABQ6GHM2_9BACL|nr:HAD hydrolase-like protein [Paenibacillus glycanilyticus]GLX69610.1 MTA/SAH nucleosidase [Paenibacillus glycanilyticus]